MADCVGWALPTLLWLYSLAYQHILGVDGVEVLTHGLDLAAADFNQEVIHVVVDLAVSGFPVGFGFERNPVTFSGNAFRSDAQPLWHGRANAFDQLAELRLG